MTRIAYAIDSRRRAAWRDDSLSAEVLGGAGVEVEFFAWDDSEVDWQAFERVIVRSARLGGDRLGHFLEWAEQVGGERLRNSPDLIKWNSDRRYLAELDGAGLQVPPTLLIAPGGMVPDFEGGVVIKAITGAEGDEMGRFGPGARAAALELLGRLGDRGEIAMVQPFLETAEQRGETMTIVFGGRFAYSLQKPNSRDDEPMLRAETDPEEIELAERAVAWLAGRFGRMPLFARVDTAPDAAGAPIVTEVELFGPQLYLSLARDLEPSGAEAFAAALIAELG